MIVVPDIKGSGSEARCRRVVVKLGSNVVMGERDDIDAPVIESLTDDIAGLRERGLQVVLVTSGAVGVGCGRLGRPRPKAIPDKQAFAAVGQIGLMHIYEGVLARRGMIAAQLLLSRADMEDRRRYLNARHALDRLLALGAVPIVNENDTTATEELNFGDNDMLSAYVAAKAKADFLLLLSTVPGVLETPPGKAPGAEPVVVPFVPSIAEALERWVDDSRSRNGVGGMKSKLAAAKLATEAGVHTAIACGKTPGIVGKVFSGDFVGTYFPPSPEGAAMSAHERWIRFGRPGKGGALVVDDGAAEALARGKKSLLPAGVVEVRGKFSPGDSVEILNRTGAPIARGLTNYSSDDVERIKGRKSADIEALLGRGGYEEVVHRDNLVVLVAATG